MTPKGTFASRSFGIVALSGFFFLAHPCPAPAQAANRKQVQEDFFQAMLADDMKSALQLLLANTNLARVATYGTKFPLHVAASKGHLEIVEMLLKLGADVNMEGDTWDTGNKKLTALEVAIWYKHPAVVKRLLEAGANPNHLSPWEGSALHFAFNYGQEEMAGWLLDHGANPFLIGGNPYQKSAPFESAITRGNGKLVPRMLAESRVTSSPTKRGAELLKQGALAPLNKQAAEYLAAHGPALLAAAAQRGELEAVEALLKAGAPTKEKTAEGYSLAQAFALSVAGAAKAKDFAPERWGRIRTLLEKHGAPCDVFAATGLGDLETARRLWSANKNLAGARDHAGETLLHWAVRADWLPFTSFWLEAGVSPAATNFAGQTALHLAAARGLAEHVQRLLAAQPPLDVRDTNGWTPLDAAIQAKQPGTIRLLLNINTPGSIVARGIATPIHEAAASGNIVALAALVNSTNIEAHNELGFTPLHLAIQSGQLGAAALLLDKDADVNARDPNGNAPLHLVVLARPHYIAGRPSATWLARMGRDPRKEQFLRHLTAKDNEEFPRGLVEAAALLLACGADATATNHAGKTVVQLAMDEATMLFEEDRTALLPLFLQGSGYLDQRDVNGDTALHRAAREITDDKAAQLIAAGADVSATNKFGRTPLHASVERIGGWGSMPFQTILKAKPNVNAQDNEDLTALHVLAISDSSFLKEATRALLDAGADPGVRDKRGRAPIHLFLSGEWPTHSAGDCILMLIAAGADPTSADDQGRTPLHYLAGLNRSPLFFISNITNSLASPKLDINATDHAGNTPLHIAARSGATDVFEWLRKLGAQLDVTNAAGETPRLLALQTTNVFARFRLGPTEDIFDAARRGDLEMLRRLLTAEPKLANATRQFGETPLRLTAWQGHTNAAALLVERGAQWDVASAAVLGRADVLAEIFARQPQTATNTTYGRSLLHLAAESGAVPAAEVLLSAGADLNARDTAGSSPLGRARMKSRPEMTSFLRRRGAAENIFDAVLLDDSERTAALLARDKSLSRDTNAFGFTAAHLAVALGREQILKLLLDQRASPNLAMARNGVTLLHVAAVCNRTNTAALLLQRKAKVEPFEITGYTPLHLAAICGSTDVAALLLKHRAKPKTPTKAAMNERPFPMAESTPAQSTALHLAALSGQTKIIELLLNAKAAVNATNAAGQTPLDLTRSSPPVGPGRRFGPFGSPGMSLRMLLQQSGVSDLTNRIPFFVTPPQQQAAVRLLEQAGAKRGRPSPQQPGWPP